MTRGFSFLPMDQEKPRTIGSIATRIVFTLVGLLILYVLGVGPAFYILNSSPRSIPLVVNAYYPLFSAVSNTPLEKPVYDYLDWWIHDDGKPLLPSDDKLDPRDDPLVTP